MNRLILVSTYVRARMSSRDEQLYKYKAELAPEMAENTQPSQESNLGRSCRSIVAISSSSLDLRPYQIHTREDGSREVEVINEDDPSPGSPALLVTTSSSSSLLSSYMEQERKLAILEKDNSDLTKKNNGLQNENKRLKEKNRQLEQKVRELEARLTATEQSQNESDQGLTYDELQKMNTVKETTYQTGQDSDASSVDEMTGQEPTLAELQNMNPVRDWSKAKNLSCAFVKGDELIQD